MQQTLKQQHILRQLGPLIGNTPLVRVRYKYKGNERIIYSKYESSNMTGSIKDRMALWILKRGYETGNLNSDSIISTVSSGNTGVAFSAIGAALRHKVRVYMPSWMSSERKEIIKSFGSEIITVTKEQGGFLGAMQLQEDQASEYKVTKNENIFIAHQFDNEYNSEAHFLFTGHEISIQLFNLGLLADIFVAGVGTGGTVMGVGKYLKRYHNQDCKIYALEPKNSPNLSTGCDSTENSHRIEGISKEIVPSILDLNKLNGILSIWDGDAILMAQMLSKHGLGVGISSGANFLGAVECAEDFNRKYGVNGNAVTVFCDSHKKYISTDLFKYDEPMKDDYHTQHIEIVDIHCYGM